MTTATKMLDWGDKAVGFEQQHGQGGPGPTTHSLVRFYEAAAGGIEIQFGSTVHYGGGVLHRSDGAIVISQDQRADLIAALYPIGGPVVSGDYLERKSDELRQLHEILVAAPHPDDDATLDEYRSWARVADKLIKEISQ